MKNLNNYIFAFLLIISIAPTTCFAWGKWKTLKTDYFTVFYYPQYEEHAWDAIRTLEYHRPGVEKLTGNSVKELPVVLEDVGAQVNGFANPVFYYTHLFSYPPTSNWSVENWWTDVGVHEYTHILHMSKTGGIPFGLKTAFGNIFEPNLLSPGWIIEGITVYSESQVSPFQGRLNDGYYDSYIAARVMDNRFPTIKRATYQPLEYPYDGIYLFGGEFFDYLSKKYGENKFAKFFDENGSSLLSFLSPLFPFIGIDRAARKMYDKSFPALWEEWKQYCTTKFRDFRIDGEQLTKYGWFVSHLKIADGKLYYQRLYPVKTGAFMTVAFIEIVERDISSGEEKIIVSSTTQFSHPHKIRNGKLYYTLDEVERGYANSSNLTYGTYSVLHERDISNGDDEKLFSAKMRSFDVLPDNDIIYSIDKMEVFGSTLYRHDHTTGINTKLFETDFIIDDIVSNEEHVIVVARRDWENFSLYELSLETHEFTPIVHTPYIEASPQLIGNEIYFTANYNEIYSIYSFDLSKKQIFQHTKNGYANYAAFDKDNNKLYFVGLNSFGYDVYSKNDVKTETSLPIAQPSKIPQFTLNDADVRRGGYFDNLKTLFPKLRFPIIFSDRDSTVLGAIIMGSDAIGDFPSYNAIASYNFKSRKPSIDLALLNNFFAPLQTALAYSKRDKQILSFDLFYPLYIKNSAGLSSVYTSVLMNYEEFSTMEFIPHFSVGFRFPTTGIDLGASVPIERAKYGSDIDRTGVYGLLHIRQYIKNSQFSLTCKGAYDKDNRSSSVLNRIRGYDESLKSKKGATLSLNYSLPLLKIKNGIWNPNIYFEDFCANAFIDAAAESKTNAQLSGGLEISLETQAFFFIALNPGLRFVRNAQGKNSFEFFLWGYGAN